MVLLAEHAACHFCSERVAWICYLFLIENNSPILPGTMNNLGPYKKYIIAAAVIQSIIVIIVGFILFKSKAMKDPLEHEGQEKSISATAPFLYPNLHQKSISTAYRISLR